jgi:hypothetical protein
MCPLNGISSFAYYEEDQLMKKEMMQEERPK